MKKREARRQIDLLSSVPAASLEKIDGLIKDIYKYSVEYNSLMEEYEEGKTDTEFLFILIGNNDPSVYQLIPLFCRHFGIFLLKIEERLEIKVKIPAFIRIRKDDKIPDTVKEYLESINSLSKTKHA